MRAGSIIPRNIRRSDITPMRVLVAPDKFKGSLTAAEAARQIADGWLEAWPESAIAIHPVADGGDGTLDAIAAIGGASWQTASARDARGRMREAAWLWRPDTETAWIEVARVCGLAALAPHEIDPLAATTAGVGDMVLAARDAGARKAILCLGGSATNDGGCGMAAALGVEFRDSRGAAFDPVPRSLSRLARIAAPRVLPVREVAALTDVRNPLLGPAGASRAYGPQKGASPEAVARLERALARLAEVAARDLGNADPLAAGTGAAGGLGFGVQAFLRGRLLPGFDTIAAATGLAAAVEAADLVITGEGRIDEQTAAGKAPQGVADLARQHGKRVIAFAGSVPLSITPGTGFDALVQITDASMTHDFAMKHAGPLLRAAAARTADLIRQNRIP